ncbi:hypothetical protein GCM10023149_10270 [Mucilaginibacter gynuensis]|uniref:FecR family protein n=1 Tax=Mucilaginibacter gynuensis TaxID=1302236 RepID=A0ABP8FZH3_9SPHI
MGRSDFNKRGKGRASEADIRLQEELVEKHFHNLDLDKVETENNAVKFDSKKVYNNIVNLIDEQEKPVRKSVYGWLAAAAMLGGLFVLSYYYRYAILDYVAPVKTIELVAAPGNMINITLGDGTKIWLNGGTKLKYPEIFRGDKREVSLEGEAFFDVKHDADMPFTVRTGALTTHVLGTSFNVKAYADDNETKVDVFSGKVGVMPSAGNAAIFNTIYLQPTEEVLYNKRTRAIVKTTGVDISSLAGWRDGELIFKKSPIGEVVSVLRRKFNVNIKADQNLSACSITANFTNVPLKDIMKVIARLVKGKATLESGDYHLKGKGC